MASASQIVKYISNHVPKLIFVGFYAVLVKKGRFIEMRIH